MKNSICRVFVLVLLTTLLSAGALSAQVHTLNVSNSSVLPGGSVDVSIQLSNDEAARGFSMGVAHSGADLTLTAITAGSATAATNSGAGPDFEFSDLNATEGPGGTYGCILSFTAPLDEIPVGTGNEIAVFTYSCAASATPGTSTNLTFSDILGTPDVQTVISIVSGGNSISRIPSKVGGAVSVATPPVSGLTCVLADPCLCDFSLSWTNGMVYDSIEILNGSGTVIETLSGAATTALVSISGTTTGGPVSDNLAVRGIANSVVSTETSCTATCPVVNNPSAPSAVDCSVNQASGVTTVSWTNNSAYSSVSVSVDGVLVETLGGTSTSTSVTIGGPGDYTISIAGTNECGSLSTSGTCVATRDNFFIRNDVNQDGTENIADPVQLLDFLFGGGSISCQDAADVNDDGTNNIADVVYSLNVIFGISVGGSVPVTPAPLGACGGDPTADGLNCVSFNGC